MTLDNTFLDSELFKWVIMPLLIFIARMCDVTLGTLRNVFISKGLRHVVPVLGFFEVLIWLISIRQIMQHLDNVMCYVSFAGGFSMGTYVGLKIEGRLALGVQVIRIITNQDSQQLILALQKENIGITVIDGQGAKGPVKIIFTLANRKDIVIIRELINMHNPTAFYSIEDVRAASQGVFRKGETDGKTMDYVRRIFNYSAQK
ncbi:MAG: DUF2179 domain-containing protein [Bacteroidetes bacterium]|nr:DUF2179 domain-containing protein [Bacteroidota bacterium]